jgi:hypothetical protein
MSPNGNASRLAVSGNWDDDVDVGGLKLFVFAAVAVGWAIVVGGSTLFDEVALPENAVITVLVDSDGWIDVFESGSVLLVSATVEVNRALEVVGSAFVEKVAAPDVVLVIIVISAGWVDVNAGSLEPLVSAAFKVGGELEV